jgi:hypothetical protein
VHIFEASSRTWYRARSEDMTQVAQVLFNMVEFNNKF